MLHRLSAVVTKLPRLSFQMGGQDLSGIWKGKQNKTKQNKRDAEAFLLRFLPGWKGERYNHSLLSTVLLSVDKKDN